MRRRGICKHPACAPMDPVHDLVLCRHKLDFELRSSVENAMKHDVLGLVLHAVWAAQTGA